MVKSSISGVCLIKVELQWFALGPVKALYEVLKPEEHYKKPEFPELNNYGFYMYLEKDAERARYIGQAYNRSVFALRRRVRWEIVKDGDGCAESAFCCKCKKYNVDRFNLLLKVAHIKSIQKGGVNVEVDDKIVNAIERALIYERAQAGDPLMNETSKKSYKLEPIEIINSGDHKPLPARIIL